MGALSPSHWIIIAVVVVVLFGANRLPQVARGVGQSLRILRSEVKELESAEGAQDPVSVEVSGETRGR